QSPVLCLHRRVPPGIPPHRRAALFPFLPESGKKTDCHRYSQNQSGRYWRGHARSSAEHCREFLFSTTEAEQGRFYRASAETMGKRKGAEVYWKGGGGATAAPVFAGNAPACRSGPIQGDPAEFIQLIEVGHGKGFVPAQRLIGWKIKVFNA